MQHRHQEIGCVPPGPRSPYGDLEVLEDQEVFQRRPILPQGIMRSQERLDLLRQLFAWLPVFTHAGTAAQSATVVP